MLNKKKKTKKINNKNLKRFTELLLSSQSWAELNLRFAICNLNLTDDVLIVICHFAFMTRLDAIAKLIYSNCNLSEQQLFNAVDHSQTILSDIADDQTIRLSNDIIDLIVKKVTFANKLAMIHQFEDAIQKKLIQSLLKRDFEFTSKTIIKYKTLSKFHA